MRIINLRRLVLLLLIINLFIYKFFSYLIIIFVYIVFSWIMLFDKSKNFIQLYKQNEFRILGYLCWIFLSLILAKFIGVYYCGKILSFFFAKKEKKNLRTSMQKYIFNMKIYNYILRKQDEALRKETAESVGRFGVLCKFIGDVLSDLLK